MHEASVGVEADEHERALAPRVEYAVPVVQGHVERVVGLDPYAGFVHALKSGRQSLTYDFAEQFRQAAVDKPLIFSTPRLEVAGGCLSRESRREVADLVLAALSKPHAHGASKAPLDQIILRKAAELASFLRGSSPAYVGFRVRFW